HRRERALFTMRIMFRNVCIACHIEERSALLDAAELLNTRMREVRDSGKVVGLDRIAVMVALNLAHELLAARNREAKLESEVGARLKAVRERVESSLAKGKQLEF